MALIEYKNGVNEHPEGWEGYRVAVLGRSKKYKQAYFRATCRKTKKPFSAKECLKIRERAIQYHNALKQEEIFLDEMSKKHVQWKFFYKDKKASLAVFFERQMNNVLYKTMRMVNSTRTFEEAWDEVFDRYNQIFQFESYLINHITASYPSFDKVNKARLAFNRKSVSKFKKRDLVEAFEV